MIDRIIISEEESVEDALSIMNETGLGLVILTDPEKRLRAVASAGDLRRALLKGKKGKLSDVANYHPISAEKGTKTEVLVDLASKAGKVVITEQQKVVDLFMDHSDMPLSIRGEQLERLACTPGEAMKDVMKRIDMSGLGIALVVEEGRLAGVVTDSDIRSAILAGAGDEEPIKKVMVKDFVRATEDMQKEKIRALNPPGKRLQIPVVD